MGQTNGPYCEDFVAGTKVRIRNAEFLENFRRTWKLHHPINAEQVCFAGRISIVEHVSFYHGGDELYTLKDVPGTWHERLLESA